LIVRVLRWRGIAARIRVLTPHAGNFAAHAVVEVGERTVTRGDAQWKVLR
jgi:hypothetical protein